MISSGLSQLDDHLEGKIDFAIQVLMQGVVPTGFILKYQRRGPELTGVVALCDEGGVIFRVDYRDAQLIHPGIGKF